MGKTAEGAVWLTEDKYSVNDFWQYWRNTSDEDVIKFLKLFTEIDLKTIDKFKDLKGSELNKLKVLLANEITSICHGMNKSKKAEYEAKNILNSRDLGSNIIDNYEQKYLLNLETLKNGISLKQILIELNLSNSNGQAKRLIEQGAVKINQNQIKEKELKITRNHFLKHPKKNNSYYFIIYVGKNKYGLVELIT